MPDDDDDVTLPDSIINLVSQLDGLTEGSIWLQCWPWHCFYSWRPFLMPSILQCVLSALFKTLTQSHKTREKKRYT